MNRHKQVLAIGRSIVGRGCDYSEANRLTRRIKYYGAHATAERLAALRKALDAAGLYEVVVKGGDCTYGSCGGTHYNYSTVLLVPIAWFTEE